VLVVAPFAMTAFLWHLTALMLVLVAARALGVVQPEVASVAWWLTRPVLFAVLAVVTAGLVALFVRFDRSPRPASGPGGAGQRVEQHAWADAVAAVSGVVLFFGILIVSIVGVDVLGNRPVFFLVGDVPPVVGFVVLGVGLAMLGATRPRATPHPTP
jgi:hypothetical protein